MSTLPLALAAIAGTATALVLFALYAALGLGVRSCAICANPVRERHAFDWVGPHGNDLHTHYGRCTELYHQQHLQDWYRA